VAQVVLWGASSIMPKAKPVNVSSWVSVVAEQTQPDVVHWWAGTNSERSRLAEAVARSDTSEAVGQDLHPEHAPVLFSTHRRADTGPTNLWISRDDAQARVWSMFRGAMRGRTMYVVPYLLGPPRSAFSRAGVQVTDCARVALAIDRFARSGTGALNHLGSSLDFNRGLHSLAEQHPARKLIVHFPEMVETWSIGSGAIGDALLCGGVEGLRLASSQAREEGWLAENMSIFQLEDDAGNRWHFAVAAADPEALAELARAGQSRSGWRLQQLGTGACWMRPGNDGSLRALDPEAREWQPPEGVKLSALLFCGRQARSTPLVYEARSWRHGVYIGATLTREAEGTSLPTIDPMSMLNRCGYNLADYFAHWLSVGRKLCDPPKIFHVNWFEADGEGRRLWPGGEHNMRVLQWIVGRVERTADACRSPLGYVPTLDSIDVGGLASSPERLHQALTCKHAALLRQAEGARKFLARFGEALPGSLLLEHRQLVRALQESLH